jgi:hypothetical protein
LAAFVQPWSWCRWFHMYLHIPIRTKGYIIGRLDRDPPLSFVCSVPCSRGPKNL